MSTFEEQHITPHPYSSDWIPAWNATYDTESISHVQLSPTGTHLGPLQILTADSPLEYTSLLVAVVSLYVLYAGLIVYLVWDRRVRRKAVRAQVKAKRDLERGQATQEKNANSYTPSTAVGTDAHHHSPQFETVHLSPAPGGSQSSPDERNYNFTLPPKSMDEPDSPFSLSSSQGSHSPPEPIAPNVAGMSIGDRLRSHLMQREITGGIPPSADALLVSTTLGVNHNGSHSRSSLFTIVEGSTEASSRNSPDIIPSTRVLTANSSRTASLC